MDQMRCQLGFMVMVSAAILVQSNPIVPSITTSASPSVDQTFLSHWMTTLYPLIHNVTLFDLALPGTHDTLTYDLSTRISDGSNDIPPGLAWVLHEIPLKTTGEFIRKQAQTQMINITAQLEAGVRFIDFRTMYTAGPHTGSLGEHDWYSLHFVESNNLALTYMTEILTWLANNPKEIIVLWLSRHGSQCATGKDQYPDVSQDVKLAYWGKIEALFGDLLFDASKSNINETTIAQLLERRQRVVFYASDFVEFTNNTNLAIDACQIDNAGGPGEDDPASLVAGQISNFQNGAVKRAQDKAAGKYWLLSMASGQPTQQIEQAALLEYDPINKEDHKKDCAKAFKIPGLVDFCPLTLLELSYLQNYYSQIALDAVITQQLDLPMAIYLNSIDTNGAIRTGTSWSQQGNGTHETISYAYADTLILYNIRQMCEGQQPPSDECTNLAAMVTDRRSKNPLTRWDDISNGRLATWPPVPS